MDIGKRILRLLDPKGERERMSMREARCITDANAEDLTRTIALHESTIGIMLQGVVKKRMNGGNK